MASRADKEVVRPYLTPANKTVFLVRHAQSEQNVATARLASGDVSALIDIGAIGYDAPLSRQGEASCMLKGPPGFVLLYAQEESLSTGGLTACAAPMQ